MAKLPFAAKKIVREIVKTFLFFVLIFSFKPDVMVLNGVTITVLPSFMPLSTKLKAWKIIKKFKKIRTLLIVHAINPPKGKTLENAFDDVSCVDLIVCVEKWMLKLISDKFPEKKVIWIHNGVNTQVFSFKMPVKNNNILFVGRLSKDHGLDTLLKAVHKIIREFPDINVRVVGDGPQRNEYLNLSKSLGLDSIVEFRGKIPHSKMPDEYYWAFIVVNPVRVAGIGISTLEAMSCGRIVLKSCRDWEDEIIIDGYNGFLFEIENVDFLAEKLKVCLKLNKEAINEIALNARKTIEEKFSEEKVFNRYESPASTMTSSFKVLALSMQSIVL